MTKTLDDIFNDDEFGLLNSNERSNAVKTDTDRLINVFEDINTFYEKHNREPSSSSVTEYNMLATLKAFRNDNAKKLLLKRFDRHNLLGTVAPNEIKSLDDVFEDDDLLLLSPEGDTSIFNFKHTPIPEDRAESDFIAQRQPLKQERFDPYEKLFQQVHKEIRSGERKIQDFANIEKNLHIGNFYILDGIMLYLESAELESETRTLRSGNRVRIDGRTVTIFENSTVSNMLFRSLGKALQKSGKLITQSSNEINEGLFNEFKIIDENDVQSGWIYVLKSKSKNEAISGIKDLYKIGFSTQEINQRIKSAHKEATYLFDEVEVIATYRCFNVNVKQLENLIHRFFAVACLDVEINTELLRRFSPREWFIVPIKVINEAIELLIQGSISNFKYDLGQREIILK